MTVRHETIRVWFATKEQCWAFDYGGGNYYLVRNVMFLAATGHTVLENESGTRFPNGPRGWLEFLDVAVEVTATALVIRELGQLRAV